MSNSITILSNICVMIWERCSISSNIIYLATWNGQESRVAWSKFKISLFFFIIWFSAGEVWSALQDLRWPGHFPVVQKLQESPDQLQHPRGGGPRPHRAARVRVQRQEAKTLLRSGESLRRKCPGELLNTLHYITVIYLPCFCLCST